jgi:UDP-N-acetylmuramate-alanine ligase
VIVPPIYFVRDSEIERTRVCSGDLVQRLIARGTDALAIDDFGAITDRIAADAHDGDLVVVMGAGPVWKIAHELVRRHGLTVRAAATCPPRAAASPSE